MMKTKMCITSKPCSTSAIVGVITGAVVLAGTIALAWMVLSHLSGEQEDPQSEVDRRIHDVESSLHRLQDTVNRIPG
jgi:hypothetical protein